MSARDQYLAAAVEIAREGPTGPMLREHIAGRFPELDFASVASLAERAEARLDPLPFVPFPNGRPANGTPAGPTWMATLDLAERAGLDLIYGLLVGVVMTTCPLCGSPLRFTDTDPTVHLHCHGGCDGERVLEALARQVRR